jgi:outer membrane protein assembly factor BamA
VELERTFDRGPFTTVRGSGSVFRTVNPHFNQSDMRQQIALQADRAITSWLRTGADGRVAHVDFGGESDHHTGVGGHVVFDTRQDPSFPRNAVNTTVSWERLGFRRRQGLRLRTRGDVLTTDVRGYVGIGGSAVLALRVLASHANAALPASEQRLLGGTDTLRGYRAGHRAGDNLAALSAEVRLPLTSPLNYGRFGVKTFVDAGTAWNRGERLDDQRFDRGIGGGVYFGATAFTGNVDLAWPREGKPRVHASLGISF